MMWHDRWNLTKRLTPQRLANAAAVGYSYQRAKATGHVAQAGLPISLAIEPTTSCNLRCPECPSGLRNFSRPTGMLQGELFMKIIDELSPALTYLTFYFQGEPFLHPQFLDLAAYANERNIYTATSTNAHFITEAKAEDIVRSGLCRMIISIDGTTQDTYQSYRIGGSLEKVKEATRLLVTAKKRLRSATPHLVFQFLVVRPNEHQIPEVYQLARSLGVNEVKLKTAQIYDYRTGSPLIPRQQKYSRYRPLPDGTYALKNNFENHCWKMWHSAVVTWDGKVVPCCFDKDAHHVMGDVSRQTFAQVWMSTAYHNFRKTLFKSRSEIAMCKNCTEGTQVWA